MEVKEININGDIHIHLNMNELYEPCEDTEEDLSDIFNYSEQEEDSDTPPVVSLGEAIDYLTDTFYALNADYDTKRYICRTDKPDHKVYFGKISNIFSIYTVEGGNRKLYIPFDKDFFTGWKLCSEE